MREAKDIYNEMLRIFEDKTGLTAADSSDLAVRLYAAAAELESLYGYCDWTLRQSFPQTATGVYLDLHAQMRQLSRKSGKKAMGSITFYLSQAQTEPLRIPAATVATTPSLVRFVTLEEGVIPAGELSVTVSAQAEEAGAHGNVKAGAITQMPQRPVAVTRCENEEDFIGGAAGEDDESLRQRVLDSYKRLPNGANQAFYESLALAHHDVAAVKVLPRRRGVGTVDVVVASKEGIPSASLLQQLQQQVDDSRELAVDVQVLMPDAIPVDVHLTVWPREEVSPQEAVNAAQAAVEEFFCGSLLGKSLYLAELGNRVFATGKVKNYVITAPSQDVLCSAVELPILGSVQVAEGE